MSTKLKKVFLAVIPLAGLLFMAPSAFSSHHHHCRNYYYGRPYHGSGWSGGRYSDGYYSGAPQYRPSYSNSYSGNPYYPSGNPYYPSGSPYSSSPPNVPWWSTLIPR